MIMTETKEARKKQLSAYKEGRRGGYSIAAKEIDRYISMRSKTQQSVNDILSV